MIELSEFGAFAPFCPAARKAPLVAAFNKHFPAYGITTPLRVAHFMAQAAHETGGFRRLVEMGNGDKDGDGEDDYFEKYDTGSLARRLGNTPEDDDDGQKFKGRGIFQLTGRYNYGAYGKKLGLDLLNRPELAAEPDAAVLIACRYWADKVLNGPADRDDLLTITKAINGGTNGLSDRRDKLVLAKQVFK